jgi:hypothetical protein
MATARSFPLTYHMAVQHGPLLIGKPVRTTITPAAFHSPLLSSHHLPPGARRFTLAHWVLPIFTHFTPPPLPCARRLLRPRAAALPQRAASALPPRVKRNPVKRIRGYL